MNFQRIHSHIQLHVLVLSSSGCQQVQSVGFYVFTLYLYIKNSNQMLQIITVINLFIKDKAIVHKALLNKLLISYIDFRGGLLVSYEPPLFQDEPSFSGCCLFNFFSSWLNLTIIQNYFHCQLQCLCTFIFYHESVSFFPFIIKCAYSLRVGKLCWRDFIDTSICQHNYCNYKRNEIAFFRKKLKFVFITVTIVVSQRLALGEFTKNTSIGRFQYHFL